MNSYNIGTTVRVWGTFKAATWTVTSGVPSASYALTDPNTISLTVRTPSGTSTTYTYAASTVSKHSTGVYYRDVAVAEAGVYLLTWVSTGAVVAAFDWAFQVETRET